MSKSLTYRITLFIIKLKGLKKNFSKDPIDYKKIRKDDIYKPKGLFYKRNKTHKFKVLDSQITAVEGKQVNDQLVIYIHGGAFISGPTKIHWDAIQQISKQTHQTVWMCNYPKAPENKISDLSKNIDAVYEKALEQYEANKILLIGDSVGGTLITALTQRLISKKIDLPRKIILISPVMDATLSNPKIDAIDKIDPMLSKIGVVSAKKMCAENNDLKKPMISPLFGAFDNFPNTIIFVAENDITYPDQQLAIQKLIEAEVEHTVFKGNEMPHIWPILPVMTEAKVAFEEIIKQIN